MYKLINTKDGSSTIISPHTGDTYHSMDGAISESLSIYIWQGLSYLISNNLNSINILEFGFGTGLNCYLTKLNQGNANINYVALEPNILPNDIIISLNYTNLIQKEKQFFTFIHNSKNLNKKVEYNISFQFLLNETDFETFNTEEKFDLIYFDGFDFRKDSNIWQNKNVEKAYSLLNKDGIIVTYASNRYLKNTLANAGFELEILPGAVNKREMIRATKI